MISIFSQITQVEFYSKIIALSATILAFFLYFVIRFIISGKNSFMSAQAMEQYLLKTTDLKISDLQTGNWADNAGMVISFGSFSLGILILAAVLIFEQQFIGYDKWMFNIIMVVSVIAVLGYFLSLQFWFLALDQGGIADTSIRFRQTATLFQTIGWMCMVFAAITTVMAVNTSIGITSCVLFFLAMVVMYERKFIVLKSQRELITKNKFQDSLSIENIYVKGDNIPGGLQNDNSVRIMTWNIERGFKPEEILKGIKYFSPDFVCLQEVDWGNQRTNEKDVLGYLSEHTSMRGYFGLEFIELDSPYRPKSFTGGGVHGNAILARIAPDEIFKIDLPLKYDWENPQTGREIPTRLEARIGSRFALCANFKINNQDLIIGSIHIEDKYTSIQDRWDQYQKVARELRDRYGENSQLVIAGDLNTLSTVVSRAFLPYLRRSTTNIGRFQTECSYWKQEFLPTEGFFDPFSCKEWTYKRTFLYHAKLDWITVRNCTILKQGRGDFHTSDHRPLWVDISI